MEPRFMYFDVPTPVPHRMEVTAWGKVENPVVLCVHGLTRNGRDFDPLALTLSRDFYVLCPDIAGRGKSEWLPDANFYQYPTYLADLLFMLGQLGITSLHWVGTSMGGILGMMAAGAAPGLLRSLVLNDIGCLIPAAGVARIRDIIKFPTRFASYEEGENVFRERCAGFGIEDDAHWRHLLGHGLVQQPDGAWQFTYDPAIFTPIQQAAVADLPLWALWPAVQAVPTLLIRGANSDLLTAETAQAMQASHPRLTYLEWAHAGHAPSLLQQKEIAPIQGWIGAI